MGARAGGPGIAVACQILSWVGVAALALYLLLLGVKFALSRRYAARPEPPTGEGPVTVLQPVLSGDEFLEEALRTTLEAVPAWANFVWLIDADDAEARRITDTLVSLAAGRGRVVVCPPPAEGENPKAVKLHHALPDVVTPFVAVLDDDTILPDRNLERAVAALDTCDLYTGLPCYLPGPNFWSALVAHFVNNNSILTYFPLQPIVGPVSLNGMFVVMRTDTLTSYGGFAPILHQMCDDYALAKLVLGRGGSIRQGVTPVRLRTTVPTAGAYFRLMHRWFVFAGVLVRDQPPRVAAWLVLFLGLPPFLLWLGLLAFFGGWWFAPLVPAALLLRHVALRVLHRRVFGGLSRFSWWKSVLAELLQPVHLIHSWAVRAVVWRGRRMRPGPGGTFTYVGGGK